MGRALLACLLVACAPRGQAPEDTAGVGAAVPVLTSVTVDCDDHDATWAFAATTDAWTGNGQVVMSVDGAYVEKHPLDSVEAAADGSADRLSLDLEVIADWRDVSVGSSTAFNCDTPELSGVLRVYTRDTGAVADCVAFGEAPERWTEWDAAVACDELLTE